MKKLVLESATSGATSSGAIASSTSGVHFPLHRRMPPTNIFGGYVQVSTPLQKNQHGK